MLKKIKETYQGVGRLFMYSKRKKIMMKRVIYGRKV